MSILTRVQTNPDIGTANASYVSELVDRVMQFIVDYCHLPRFPEAAVGYAKSGSNPDLDLSGLDDGSLRVTVNGVGPYSVSVTTSNCTSGANTASELQTQIRAIGRPDFEEVTVAYTGTPPTDYYLISSGRYGEESSVEVSFPTDLPEVARALRLSPKFGGTEQVGSAVEQALEDAALRLEEEGYRRLGIEGTDRADLPGGMTVSLQDLDPQIERVLQAYRRLGA